MLLYYERSPSHPQVASSGDFGSSYPVLYNAAMTDAAWSTTRGRPLLGGPSKTMEISLCIAR